MDGGSTAVVFLFLLVIVGVRGRQLPPEIVASGERRMMMSQNSEMRNRLLAFNFLKNYGYYDVSSLKTDGGDKTADQLAALQDFQEFMGLPVTNDFSLDDELLAVLRQPRCKVVDPVDSMNQPFTFIGGKWNKSEITYRTLGSVPGFSRKKLASVVRSAFDAYTPYVPVTFEAVERGVQRSDILIEFRSQESDPTIDGPGNAVGTAAAPLADSVDCGKIKIDADEHYSSRGPERISLLTVIAHEIGHALGLGHTNVKGALMYPSMPTFSPEVHLHQVDIAALRQLYSDVGTDDLSTQNLLCSMTSYDAVTVMDDNLFVFKDDRFWELTTTGSLESPSEGVLISSVWPEVEEGVDVVFENSLGHVVILKGGKYYEYDATGILFPWAPASTRTLSLPKNAEAGYSIQQSSFFMRDGKLWFMDEVTRRVHPDSPKSIRKLWKITLDHVDSAFLLNDYLYILNGQDYQRLEASTTHLESESRNFARDFLGC